jgi:proline iminopeptidase
MMHVTEPASALYPEIEPYHVCYLPVSDGHQLYVEAVGNPSGIPILFIHGGPGGRSWPWDRRLFNPQKFRVILYHQRGCGWSKPVGSIENNTTWHLLQDIEVIRQYFAIKQWHVFGGSWGATLALLYAQKYPRHVVSLLLRGVFLSRPEDIQWLYQAGAHWHYPDYYKVFSGFVPEAQRHHLVNAYYECLCLPGVDETIQARAAEHWFNWESGLCSLVPSEQDQACHIPAQEVLNLARLETHYFYHQAFLTEDTAILNPGQLKALKHIPVKMVQGRYDMVCPPLGAWQLKTSLPMAKLYVTNAAGHSQNEPGILDMTLKLLDAL